MHDHTPHKHSRFAVILFLHCVSLHLRNPNICSAQQAAHTTTWPPCVCAVEWGPWFAGFGKFATKNYEMQIK